MKHLSFWEFAALSFGIDRSVKSALRDSMPGYKPDAYDKAFDCIEHGVERGVGFGLTALVYLGLLGLPVAIWFWVLVPLWTAIPVGHEVQLAPTPEATPQFAQRITIGESYTAHLELAPWDTAPRQIVALFKGTVEDYRDLPLNAKNGDCWYVKARSQYTVFANSLWNLIGVENLQPYAPRAELVRLPGARS